MFHIPKIKNPASEKKTAKKNIEDLIEAFLYYALAGWIIFSIVKYPYFPSLDGIPHIYNSIIYKHLLFYSDSIYEQAYKFVAGTFTNFTDHFLMAFLMLVFPASKASQIILGISMFLMAWSFRYLIRKLHAKSYASFLILPFLINTTFLMGMVNFNLAIGIALLCIAKITDLPYRNAGRYYLLAGLFTLTFLTHLFIYGFLFLAALIIVLYKYKETKGIKERKRLLVFILFVNIVPALLFFWYLFHQTGFIHSFLYDPAIGERIKRLLHFRILYAYNIGLEKTTIVYIQYSYLLFLVVAVINSFKQYRKSKIKYLSPGDYRLVFAGGIVFTAILIILLPQAIGGAGSYVTWRLELVFFVCLSLFVSLLLIASKRYMMIILIPYFIGFGLHLGQLKDRWEGICIPVIDAIMECSKQVEGGEVMPVYGDVPWYMMHYSNAIGIGGKAIVLENYEAEGTAFPLEWREEYHYYDKIQGCGRFSQDEFEKDCLMIKEEKPAYILYIGKRGDIFNPGEHFREICSKEGWKIRVRLYSR